MKQKGFTLIELSIVLVIIGLIVGGVLVGQDLIKAAQMRSTVSQVESFKTAAYAFKNKYSEYPGDISASKAAAFGFVARSGAVGHGDNNRLFDGCSSGATVLGCETALFWRDLSQANLIEASLSSATDALVNVAAGSVGDYLPSTSLSESVYTIVHNGSADAPTNVDVLFGNHFTIGGITSTDASGVYNINPSITPEQGFQMDTKIDDGYPRSGLVQGSYRTSFNSNEVFSFSDGCLGSAPPGSPIPYAVNGTPNEPLCFISFKFQ